MKLFSSLLLTVASAAALLQPAQGASSLLQSLDYRYFVAGGTCAAFSHGITTPIDVVKTKIQANPKLFEGKSLASATASILKTDGAASLLAGLGPTVVGYGVEGAMKFGVYEVCKPIFAQLLATKANENPAMAFILSSAVAGAVAAILLCPMESLRIRQVTDEEYADTSLFSGLPMLIRDNGILALFGGVWAMLAKQIPYTFGKQVSFDIVAVFLYSFIKSLTNTDANKWLVSVLAAFCASIVACLCSQPGDMILTETYKGDDDKSFPQVIDSIWTRGGLGEFFRGTGARIVHVGLIITSQLVVYDIVKQLLGLPATGSH